MGVLFSMYHWGWDLKRIDYPAHKFTWQTQEDQIHLQTIWTPIVPRGGGCQPFTHCGEVNICPHQLTVQHLITRHLKESIIVTPWMEWCSGTEFSPILYYL